MIAQPPGSYTASRSKWLAGVVTRGKDWWALQQRMPMPWLPRPREVLPSSAPTRSPSAFRSAKRREGVSGSCGGSSHAGTFSASSRSTIRSPISSTFLGTTFPRTIIANYGPPRADVERDRSACARLTVGRLRRPHLSGVNFTVPDRLIISVLR